MERIRQALLITASVIIGMYAPFEVCVAWCGLLLTVVVYGCIQIQKNLSQIKEGIKRL